MSNDIALAIAREKALMEEEKWLIENLKKIRSQRNALKVEALYFQGLKAELFQSHAAKFACKSNAGDISYAQSADGSFTQNADGSYTQNANGNSYSQNAASNSNSQNDSQPCFYLVDEEYEPIPEPVNKPNPSNIEDFNLLEQKCNEMESLNLNTVRDNNPRMDMDPEYDSEEEEEDEWDKISLEMGLLVGGHCNRFEEDSN